MPRTWETNSLEVHWFGDGAPPDALRDWIGGFSPVDASSRTDRYHAPVDPAVNLKLRGEDGRFVELKRRLGSPTRRTLACDVTGDVEQYYNWSFPVDGRPELLDDDVTGLWLPVGKTRLLHTFDVPVPGSADGDEPTPTAQIELTRVSAVSAVAWTYCLEVVGAPAVLEDALVAAGNDLFDDDFPLALSATQSVRYAEWLAGLTAHSAVADEVLTPSNRDR